MLTVTQALAEEGPLADRVEGFHVRPQQQAMAAAIERTLDDNGVLICEAGQAPGRRPGGAVERRYSGNIGI